MLKLLQAKLIERARKNALRVSSRTLTFHYWITREIDAYHVVWARLDRCLAYEFAPEATALMQPALDCAEQEGCEMDAKLARVVDYVMAPTEAQGCEISDDSLARLLAQRCFAAFNSRRRNEGDA